MYVFGKNLKPLTSQFFKIVWQADVYLQASSWSFGLQKWS